MDAALTKVGNGFHSEKNGTNKNRLRIQGTAILERDNKPNITASYDYSTLYANEFFEEDVNQLQCFELNKIALGMTIYKQNEKALNHEVNGKQHSNGTSLMLQKFHSDTTPPNSEPFLTDVIWSRMDIANPSGNPNAYIIKQYYPKIQRNYETHAEKCNNFWCGFLSCFIMISLACALAFISQYYQI